MPRHVQLEKCIIDIQAPIYQPRLPQRGDFNSILKSKKVGREKS